jgi:hypothetical protein
VEQDVNRILGNTYGELSVKAAEAAAEVRNTGISEMMPVVIHQHNYFGSYYQNNTPEGLVDLLRNLVEKNIVLSENIMAQLIQKLEVTQNGNFDIQRTYTYSYNPEGYLMQCIRQTCTDGITYARAKITYTYEQV